MPRVSLFSTAAAAFVIRQAIARMATADAHGHPHVVPICFAFDGHRLYTPIDRKPKRVAPRELRRVKNLRVNPYVAVVFDRYADDWRDLAYVLVHGKAGLLERGAGYLRALSLLTAKYRQYRNMQLASLGLPVIAITPLRVTIWGRL